MKYRLVTFAGALALLAVLGKFYAKPLLAQVRAALVQNVDEPGRHPFMGGITELNFTATPQGQFATVPANQRLVIQEIHFTYFGTTANSVLVAASGRELLRAPLTPVLSNGKALNVQMTAYVDAGQAVVFSLDNPVTGDLLFGTLTGYLVDCSAAGSCANILP